MEDFLSEIFGISIKIKQKKKKKEKKKIFKSF